MVTLSPTQLKKPYYSNHKFYGIYEDRGERFLDKIKNKEPFELTDGSSSIILKNSPGVKSLIEKNYNELSGGKKLFIKEDGELISLSNFIKTEEFGSSKGQGAGTKNTSLQESSQCVFNSMLQSLKKTYLDIEDVTMENISSSYNFCDVTESWEDIYEFSQNKSWQQSFLTSSNLISQYMEEMNYENHRESKFIDSLYDSYKTTGLRYQADKWNPSDIWLVKPEVKDVEFSSSLKDLNNQVKEMFDKKELIGISLKKVGKNPQIVIKNYDKNKKNKYEYFGYKTTKKSKDVYILYNGGKICFRTFQFATNWAGEISGETASHGKIGTGPTRSILKPYDVLPEIKDIKNIIEFDVDKYKSSMICFFQKYIEDINSNDFDIFIQNKSLDWKISKFFGLKLISIIENQPKEIQNKIITNMINYASSESDESSVFLKIS